MDGRVYMLSQNPNGNKLINGFFYNRNGHHYCIPEPDPVLIYFHTAYSNWKVIKEREKALFDKLKEPIISESVSNELYNHFAVCMGFATTLFICLEAFINSLIPDDYEFKEVNKSSTVIYNKDQVQFLNFDLKWTKVIKEVTGKDLHANAPMRQFIVNLKEFRNMIVHTKMKSEGMTPYDYLFKTALNFKYEQTLHAARDYINFYKPMYVVECECGKDF